MNMEAKLPLFATPLVRIEDVVCHRPHRGPSGEECKAEHEIGIPLSGVNLRHIGGKTFTVSPAQITLSNRGEAYRVSHPFGSGETQLSIVLQEDLLLDLICARDPGAEDRRERPFLTPQIPVDAKLHFAAQLLAATARSRAHSTLELEETTIFLIEQILGAGSRRANGQRLTPRDLQIAHQARATLAVGYDQPISLPKIAAGLSISVYHLCRVFRRATGLTLWREVQQLRVRAALTRLAAGERDLTTLGLALGFSHHSHFAATFRRELGLTPSEARRLLETGSIREVRQLLDHRWR